MAVLTAYGRKKATDHILAKAAWSVSSPVYLALFTADPGDSGSPLNEVSGGAYARQAITSAMTVADASTGIATNASAITFASPTADWGDIVALGFCDAASGGNVIMRKLPNEVRRIVSGGPALVIDAGTLDFVVS